MKTGYAALVLVSLAFMAFSWVFGQKMKDVGDLWSRDLLLGSRSRAEADQAWAEFKKDSSDLHLVVKLVSVVYYVGAAAVLMVGSQKARDHKGWRIALLAGASGALLMAGWSLLLSGHISFDEVFYAWLGASGAIGVLCLTRLWASARVPAPC